MGVYLNPNNFGFKMILVYRRRKPIYLRIASEAFWQNNRLKYAVRLLF